MPEERDRHDEGYEEKEIKEKAEMDATIDKTFESMMTMLATKPDFFVYSSFVGYSLEMFRRNMINREHMELIKSICRSSMARRNRWKRSKK